MNEPQSPTYTINTEKTPNIATEEPIKLKDTEGNVLIVPYKPKPKCKKCFGRGRLGKDVINGGLIACTKCYPKYR